MVLCVFIRIALSIEHCNRNENTTYLHVKENQEDIPITHPDLAI